MKDWTVSNLDNHFSILWNVLVLLSRTPGCATDEGSDPTVNKDAKMAVLGGTTRGIRASQKILKISCFRLAKNAFAIQYLLHYSTVYTFTHYCTIKMIGCTHNCISDVIPTVQVAFFLLIRIFLLNFSFYLLLNFYNYLFFLSWGNIFWEFKKFSGTKSHGPILFPPLIMELSLVLSTVIFYDFMSDEVANNVSQVQFLQRSACQMCSI